MTPPPRFALLVTLRVRPDAIDSFRAGILTAAAAAVANEEHCQRFDVAQDEDDPATFVLFEVYTDAAALEHHHTTEHFRRFSAEHGGDVLEKSRQRLALAVL